MGAFPGFVPGGHGRVVVEVYEVDSGVLARLDEIEQYRPGDDTSYYVRISIPVSLSDGTVVAAGIYEVNRAHFTLGPVIPGGDWIAHVSALGELPPEHWPDGSPIERHP